MNILAKFSLKNKALIALVTIVISIFGAISLTSLKQELIPAVNLPQVFVITSYPGASPEVVQKDVSIPIESAVRGIAGLEGTTSTSAAGSSTVTVSFDYGYDLIFAEQKVQQAINRISRALPDNLEPMVFTGGFDDLPVLQIAASGLDQNTLNTNLENSVIPELKKVDGVRDVTLVGAIGQRITITPDQDKLMRAQMSASVIAQTLNMNGVLVPAGQIKNGENNVFVQVGSPLDSVEAIKDLPLVGTEGLTLADVADIELVPNPQTSISRVNGQDALSISIMKEPGANTVTVSNAVKDLLPDLGNVAGGVTFTAVFDQAPFIETSINTLAVEGLLGLIFAIVIILIFLFSIRSTLVTAISIPTSVLITFIGMWVSDYSLNILTLGALTISIGRVVDDSIVVVENIKRHLVVGVDRVQAILTGVREVAGAITASTATTVAVFLPIALVSGMAGELFRPFALTVTIALAASLLVAITIVPVLAYWFLKAAPAGQHTQDLPAVDEVDAAAAETRLQRAYLPVLRATLRWPALTILVSLLILGGTVALVPQMKTNFIGDSGQDTLSVSQELPAGLSLDKQSEEALAVEEILMNQDGIDVVQTTIGSSGSSVMSIFGGSSSKTRISYNLTLDGEADAELVQQNIREALDRVSTERSVFSISAAGGGMAFSTAIEVDVQGPDRDAIETATRSLVKNFTDSGEFVEVTSSIAERIPTVEVSVKRDKAAEVGFSEASLAQLISAQMQPQQIGQIKIDAENIRVFLSTSGTPETLQDLEDLEIFTAAGMMKLSDLADVNLIEGPSTIQTIDAAESLIVSVLPADDDLGTASAAVESLLEEAELPVGVTASVGGIAAEQTDSFNQLGIALLLAILIVYVIMVATFRSLRQPLLLLISVPFSATGAIGMLLITDSALGVASIIGVLMLVGIVVTNSIVMIDLVNQYRSGGLPAKQAVVLGASRRLRPILMTALATIFALIPMALGVTGHSGFISAPLALVVIGGLISSTVLTLLVLPALYWWVEGAKERREAKRAGRPSAPMTDALGEAVTDGSETDGSVTDVPETGVPETDVRPKHAADISRYLLP